MAVIAAGHAPGITVIGKFPRRDRQMVEQDARLVITPVPALVDALMLKEREKGSPLTEAEVVEIRDNAVCNTLPLSERELR